LVVVLVISVVAIRESRATPIDPKLDEIRKAVDDSTTLVMHQITDAGTTIVSEIEKVGDKVDSAALTQLELMFPLAIRIERFDDDGVTPLSGHHEAPVFSFKSNGPMKLYGGDTFEYTVFFEGPKPDRPGTIELVIPSKNRTFPIRIDPNQFTHGSLTIPGAPPTPFTAYFSNPDLLNVSVKVILKTTGAERARDEFRRALLALSSDGPARKTYKNVSVELAKLRATPSASGNVLRMVAKGTFVKVLSVDQDWAEINLPEGHHGWLNTSVLAPIQ
jgi:hypothetical protein